MCVTAGGLQVEDLQRDLTDIKEDSTADEQRHKEEVNRLRAERERTKKEHATQTDELLQRLQNACAQRDEAREQVLCLFIHPIVSCARLLLRVNADVRTVWQRRVALI